MKGLHLNRKDLRDCLVFSVLFALIAGILLVFLDNNDLHASLIDVINILSNFSLAFIGFLITAFTFLQFLQSKEWFSDIKETKAFKGLISSFQILILGSMGGFFISFILKLSATILCNPQIIITIIVFVAWLISFLVVFAWKAVKIIIELFKV
jgi:hypothetical protein